MATECRIHEPIKGLPYLSAHCVLFSFPEDVLLETFSTGQLYTIPTIGLGESMGSGEIRPTLFLRSRPMY